MRPVPWLAAALVATALAFTPNAARANSTRSQLLSGPSPYGTCGAALSPRTGTTGEVQLAVDPRSGEAIAVWMQDRAGRSEAVGIEVARSSPSRGSWVRGGPSRSSACTGGTAELVRDPSVSIGPDGRAYLVSIGSSQAETGPTGIQASTSIDGGRSWSEPVAVAGGLPFVIEQADFPRVVADPTTPGRAYLAWFTSRPGFLPVSTTNLAVTEDGGATWTHRTTGPPTPPGTVFAGVALSVRLDGSLVALIGAVDSATLASAFVGPPVPDADAPLLVTESFDGGVTWRAPVEVARLASPSFPVVDPDSGLLIEYLRASGALTSDGTFHVVWQERPTPAGWVVRHRTVGPGLVLGPTRAVSTSRSAAFQPTLGTRDGELAMTIYDLDDDVTGDGRTDATIRSFRSTDGGASWVRDTLVGPFDLRGSVDDYGLFVGNQHAVAAVDGRLMAAQTVAGSEAAGQPGAVWLGTLHDDPSPVVPKPRSRPHRTSAQ